MKPTPSQKIYYTARTVLSEGVINGVKLASSLFLRQDVFIRPKGYRHNFAIRGGHSDPSVAFATFIKKEYRTPLQDQIDLILDLGGNVGYSAIYFSEHYPKATIVALEPDRTNYECLLKNTSAYPNIVALNKGVWWRKALVAPVDPNAESWEYRFEESTDEGVECVTIADLLNNYGGGKTVMVKMDIEGAEREIFENDPRWLQSISLLQLEIHGCWKSVFDALAPHDYNALLSGENLVIGLRGNPVL